MPCSVPTTPFLYWCYFIVNTIDSVAMMVFEMPSHMPVTQVEELFGRVLILMLILLLFDVFYYPDVLPQ